MTFCRRSLALVFAAGISACQTLPDRHPCLQAEKDSETPCRPFRAGVVKFNPALDAIKPLATIDAGGWVSNGSLIFGSPDDRWLGAFKLDSYDPQWFHPLTDAPSAPMSIHGDQVIVGLRDGKLLSVDVSDGSLKWSQNLGRFISRPLAFAGNTIVAVNVDQQVFGLDSETGNRKWVYDAGRPSSLVVQGAAAPIISGQQILLGTANGEIHSIDLTTGRVNWKHSPRFSEFRFRDVVGQLAVFNQSLLAARYDGKLMALDIGNASSRVVWENDFSSITSTAFRDGILYVGLLNGDVIAVNASNGKQIWKTQTGETVYSLTTGESTLYVGGSDGRISALANRDGLLLWHDDLQGSLTQAPLLVDGLLYFATGLKVLYAYKIL
ncbi:MAG: PQQ-binding-like beta-propeller repeat protein [Oligoflexus sp.]